MAIRLEDTHPVGDGGRLDGIEAGNGRAMDEGIARHPLEQTASERQRPRSVMIVGSEADPQQGEPASVEARRSALADPHAAKRRRRQQAQSRRDDDLPYQQTAARASRRSSRPVAAS